MNGSADKKTRSQINNVTKANYGGDDSKVTAISSDG